MSENSTDVWDGFEKVFDQLATPDALREAKGEIDSLSMTSDEAGSLAEEIDPEELEARATKSTKTKKPKAKVEEEEDQEEEDDDLNEDDDDEVDDETENLEDIDEDEDDEEEEIEDSEEVSDEEIVGSFFELFSEELGWEVEDEDKPKDIKGLVGLMSSIIDDNSSPKYANEEVAKMDEFVKNGGDLRKYYQSTISGIDVDNVDLEKEANQKAVVKEFLKSTTGLTDAKIERRVNRYDESGTLEEEAEEALELLKEHKETTQKKLLKDQENFKKAQLKEQQKFVTDVQGEIEGMKSINGIPLTSKDKKDLVNYLFKVNNDGKTAYQNDYSKSIKNLIVSAYHVKEGDKAYSKLKKTAGNDAVKDLKKRINKNKTKTKNQKPYQSGSSNVFDTIDAMSKVLSSK